MTDAWAEFEKYEKGLIVQGKAEGKTERAAEDVLAVLSVRGLDLTPPQEQRIRSCQDASLLSRWLVRAVTAPTTEQIFDDTASLSGR